MEVGDVPPAEEAGLLETSYVDIWKRRERINNVRYAFGGVGWR